MKTPSPLDILVLTDFHYQGMAAGPCSTPPRRGEWSPLFLKRALNRLRQRGITPGLIVLLGDLLNNGESPDADLAWLELAAGLQATGIPILAAAGNHDARPERMAAIFNSPPGLHRVGGYGFLLFNDRHVGDDHFVRDGAALALPAQAAAANPGMPLIALQHNPLFIPIVCDYPFLPDNAAAIVSSYDEAGVALSLSGHFHPGAGPERHGNTVYCTAPTLAEAPFRFLHVRLEGREAKVETHSLAHAIPGLGDAHCHTEFAYCATDITAARNIELARLLGMEHICFTEHAFHLYFPSSEAWGGRWVGDADAVAEAWSRPGRGRMAAYRAFADSVRSPFVRAGLEVDIHGDGQLLLAPEDRGGWDILIGAVHYINGVKRGETPQAEVERLFMRNVDALLAAPVKVLAHPFRFFAWNGCTKPAHLFVPVAERLAAAGVAAELNFHGNEPEPEFFRACLERNVRIAFGSDAHCLMEPADFDRNIRFMRDLGVSETDLPGILFRP